MARSKSSELPSKAPETKGSAVTLTRAGLDAASVNILGNGARPKKTAELVADQIRDAIIRGDLKTGDNLPAEGELIAHFEISRPTIREAIRILESEKLLQVARGARGGARISQPTTELVSRAMGLTLQARRISLSDVYNARMIIEPPAARMAAENSPKATAAVLRTHLFYENEMIADRQHLARAFSEFHRALVEQCGNATLSLIADALAEITAKHLALLHRSHRLEESETQRRRSKLGVKSHARLADLIYAGDGPGAEAHWRKHMENASEFWLQGLGASGLDILN